MTMLDSPVTELPESPAPHNAAAASAKASGRGRGRVALLFGAALLVMGGAFAAGFLPRLRQKAELASAAEAVRDAKPVVRVATVSRSAVGGAIELPGSLRADEETLVYARGSGYLKRYAVDIGDTVKQGQLLAEIDSPEVVQDLQRARAEVGVARAALRQREAALRLAEVTAQRVGEAAAMNAVSEQEKDEKQLDLAVKQADVASARATVEARQADVHRLEQLLEFDRVTAPYDGVVTARNVDPGALVTATGGAGAAGSGGGGRELFRVARIDTLRLTVNVPESLAPLVRPGQKATLSVAAYPGRTFEATVSRTARAVDPASRTLLAELRAPNADHALLPGTYAQVKLTVDRPDPPVVVPASALIVGTTGVSVAVLQDERTVRLQPLGVGRDYGSTVEVTSGLKGGERIVLNPGTELSPGQEVAVQATPPLTPPAAAAPAAATSGAARAGQEAKPGA